MIECYTFGWFAGLFMIIGMVATTIVGFWGLKIMTDKLNEFQM